MANVAVIGAQWGDEGKGKIVDWLSERAEVVALVRDWVPRSNLLSSDLVSRVTMVRGDVRDQDLLERVMGEYEIDTVFHLAAQTDPRASVARPMFDAEVNVLGTLNLCEAALAAGTRKVVLATSIAETSLTIEGVRLVIDGGVSVGW